MTKVQKRDEMGLKRLLIPHGGESGGVMLRGAYRYDLWYDNAHTHAFVCGLNQSVLVVTSTTFQAHLYVLGLECTLPLVQTGLLSRHVLGAGGVSVTEE